MSSAILPAPTGLAQSLVGTPFTQSSHCLCARVLLPVIPSSSHIVLPPILQRHYLTQFLPPLHRRYGRRSQPEALGSEVSVIPTATATDQASIRSGASYTRLLP